MKTFNELTDIVRKVKFQHHPNLRIRTRMDDRRPYVQLVDEDMDPSFNTGRKWFLSEFMTTSEVVGTIWKAYETWIEHEARESFTYDGRAVYGPHLDVEALWRAAGDPANYEYRS